MDFLVCVRKVSKNIKAQENSSMSISFICFNFLHRNIWHCSSECSFLKRCSWLSNTCPFIPVSPVCLESSGPAPVWSKLLALNIRESERCDICLINLFKILFLCFTGPWEYDKKIEDSGAKSWKERNEFICKRKLEFWRIGFSEATGLLRDKLKIVQVRDCRHMVEGKRTCLFAFSVQSTFSLTMGYGVICMLY